MEFFRVSGSPRRAEQRPIAAAVNAGRAAPSAPVDSAILPGPSHHPPHCCVLSTIEQFSTFAVEITNPLRLTMTPLRQLCPLAGLTAGVFLAFLLVGCDLTKIYAN